MEAIEFVVKYENYLNEIAQVVKPEYDSVVGKLKAIDPHDLVRPESWFPAETDARGFVWTIFLKEINNQKRNNGQ